MGMPERFIREMLAKGNIRYSEHAIQRMGERRIMRPLVECAIVNGHVLAIQDFPDEDIKVLFHSINEIDDPFYVIVAATFPQVVVVTVCFFEEDVWEQLGNIRRRRGHK